MSLLAMAFKGIHYDRRIGFSSIIHSTRTIYTDSYLGHWADLRIVTVCVVK